MNRRRRSTFLRSLIGDQAARNFSRTSRARRAARGTNATGTLQNAQNRRYVNDPTGRYGSERYGVFNRRTGARVGTMVGMAH